MNWVPSRVISIQRRVGAVAEADVEQHLDRHLAVQTLDDADDVAAASPIGMKSMIADGAAVADELGLEDQLSPR